MSRKRKTPTLKTKLAAALVLLGEIPYAQAQQMTADQVLSLFQWDHGIYHVWEGSDDFWNLEPMFIRTHRAKTKRDVKIIAKVRKAEKRRSRSVTTVGDTHQSTAKAPARERKGKPMAGSKNSGWRRRMNGKAERRPQL